MLGDQLVRVVPADRPVVVVPVPQHHRMGEPALLAQPKLGPGLQVGDRVPGEELRRGDALGGLLGDRLGAVLAEFGEPAAAWLLGPRASRTVEPLALVQPCQRRQSSQRPHRFERALHRHHHGFDAGGFAFCARGRDVVFVVNDFDVAGDIPSCEPAANPHPANLGRRFDDLHHTVGDAGGEQPAGGRIDAERVRVLHGRQPLYFPGIIRPCVSATSCVGPLAGRGIPDEPARVQQLTSDSA